MTDKADIAAEARVCDLHAGAHIVYGEGGDRESAGDFKNYDCWPAPVSLPPDVADRLLVSADEA